jgi:nitrogen regulatory protein P-II 1
MKKLEIIVRHSRFSAVKDALVDLGVHGMTITDVKGFGRQKGHVEIYRGTELNVEFIPKIKVETVIEHELVEKVLAAVQKAACTENVGDGKIFVSNVEDVVRIRTGESGRTAL